MRPHLLRRLAAAAAALALPLTAGAAALLPTPSPSTAAAPAPATCGQIGQWLAPQADGRFSDATPLTAGALVDRLADRQVVLLGEAHDEPEDHRWQLHTLAQLHVRHPRLALSLEMFPRRLQPVLDRWVAGELSESAFLREAEWQKVWGFDARDYLPLFHFARMNRLPMLAMNVERTLVDAVARDGWDAVPEAKKEGVTRPAKPSADYLKLLRVIFDHHPDRMRGEKAFPTFAEAQTVWDRGMAETIAAHLRQHPDTLVVGIVGAGHVRHGYGIAHQLRDLGVPRVAGLITWRQDGPCAQLAAGIADAVRIVATPVDNPPRLGISMDQEKEGVRIVKVLPGSVAEQAGIREGDLLVEAAGKPLRDIETLRAAVIGQPPGTWLPLKAKRDGSEVDIVARFPVSP